MDSNYPDSFPGESDTEYENRKWKESRASVGLLFGIASFIFFTLKMAVIFGIYFYVGFIFSQKLLVQETSKSKIWTVAILFTYVIFCIIYFFKGTVIGLRTKNNKLWILPWVVCVLICCIIPAVIAKALVSAMFDFTEQQGVFYNVLTWGTFIFSALYIYDVYQFKTYGAPRVLYWSYALGLKISL